MISGKNIIKAIPYFVVALVIYFWLIPLAYTQYEGLIKTTGQIVGFEKNFSNYSIGINARSDKSAQEKILVKYSVNAVEYGDIDSNENLYSVSIDGIRKAGDSIEIYYDKKFPDQYIPASDYDPNDTIFAYLICGLSVFIGISKLFKSE